MRRHCCSQGIGVELPLVIPRPQASRKKDEDDDQPEEEEDLQVMLDEFEHLGINQVQRVLNDKKSAKSRSVARSAHRTSKHKKASQKSLDFDHEASFAESGQYNSNHVGHQHSSSGARRSTHQEDFPLLEAIKKGRFDQVDRCLREIPDSVNRKDNCQQTPIFWVSASGNMDALRSCLDYQASVQVANKYGYTPLMRALRHGRAEVAEELCKFRADLASKDKHQSSVLQIAARAGQVESVEWLLRQPGGQNQVLHCDEDGVGALQVAVRGGHAEVARLLLEAHSKPDGADEAGRTPLLFAMARNDVDLAQHLIDSQADVNAETEDGRSVLLSLVENLVKHPEHRTASLCGIAGALEANAEVDHADEKGRTALGVAVQANDPTLCALLAAHGADVMQADQQGRSLLQYVKKKGLVDIVKVLTDFGALRLRSGGSMNRTLLRAVYYGHSEGVKKLLDRSADPQVKTRGGKPAMDMAKACGAAGPFRIIKEFMDERQRLDAEEEAQGHAMGIKNKEVLELWLGELRDSGIRAGRVQVAARANNDKRIIDVMMELNRIKGVAVGDSVSATLLSAFLKQRTDLIIRKARAQLRRIRVQERRKAFLTLTEKLEQWDTAEHPDKATLNNVMTLGIANVRFVKASEWENGDKYTRELESCMDKAMHQPLQLLNKFPSVWAEVEAGREEYPMNAKEIPLQANQCGNCMMVFLSEAAWEQHAEYCQSTIGDERRKIEHKRRRAKAESTIHHVRIMAKKLIEVSEEVEAAADEVRQGRRENMKKFPEAMPVFQGAYVLTKAFQGICAHRAQACDKWCVEACKDWDLRQLTVASDKQEHPFCLLCFVGEVTRVLVHKDGERHKCLCKGCAYQMNAAKKAGKTPVCPECMQPFKDILVTSAAPKSARGQAD